MTNTSFRKVVISGKGDVQGLGENTQKNKKAKPKNQTQLLYLFALFLKKEKDLK